MLQPRLPFASPSRGRMLLTLALAEVMSLLVGCASTSQVSVWPTSAWCLTAAPAGADLPEATGGWLPGNRLASGNDTERWGVAFSGGGSRAASAAIGQLRALHALPWSHAPGALKRADYLTSAYDEPYDAKVDHWIDHVAYISAVSGGAWLSSLYWYSPASDEDLLGLKPMNGHQKGHLVHPTRLSNALLNEASGYTNLLSRAFQQGTHFDYANQLHAHYSGTGAYGVAIADALLPAVGLAPFEQPLASAAKPAGDTRPFLIVSSTLYAHREQNASRGDMDLFPLELTPYYSGIRCAALDDQRRHQGRIGGAYVSSEAVFSNLSGYTPPTVGTTTGTVGVPAFDGWAKLADALGTTGAAPVREVSEKLDPTSVGFPEYSYTVPTSPASPAPRFIVADGAHIDNLGLLPLLARQVRNIMVFINTPVPIASGEVLDDLRAVFDQLPERHKAAAFKPELLPGLVSELRQLDRAGQPTIAIRNYTKDDFRAPGVGPANGWFGVFGYDVTIAWVYLSPTRSWLNEIEAVAPNEKLDSTDPGLSSARKEGLLYGSGDKLERFPYFNTALEDGLQAIDLDAVNVESLANLTAWTLITSAEHIDGERR